jgi:hypothetical protein
MMEFIRNIVIGSANPNGNSTYGAALSQTEVVGEGQRYARHYLKNAAHSWQPLFFYVPIPVVVTCMAALCNASSSAQFACREDKHVSYGFVEKQGRRGNMEDFTYAQVSVK